MRKIDMHFHTKLSDGRKSNEELVSELNKEEIAFMAVSDHDIVNYDFYKLLKAKGIDTAYSTELSTCDYSDNKSMHILRYSSQINSLLDTRLETLRNARIEKIKLQIESLLKNGFTLKYDEFISYFDEKGINVLNLNAFHIARYIYKEKNDLELIKNIYGKEEVGIETFYKNFLKEGGNFSKIGWISVGDYEIDIESLEKYNNKNTIYSLAHVNETFKKGIDEFKSKIEKLVELGVNAIEINSVASKERIEAIFEYQKKFDLILTFGSDCHFKSEFDGKHGELFQMNKYLGKETIFDNYEKIIKKLS